MCGRTAQTNRSIATAATLLGLPHAAILETGASASSPSHGHQSNSATASSQGDNHQDEMAALGEDKAAPLSPSPQISADNYNLSPGMEAVVFYYKDGSIQAGRKVWGLVPRNGTEKSPLPRGMSQHFSNLMYNARTDTLAEKPTFSPLLLRDKKTCLVPVTGYFEWKQDNLAGPTKRQPYFVHRNEPPFLLLAGLWTSVKTGRVEDPDLDTFTILTTEACSSLQWLHHRMPVCIWDDNMARMWLEDPSKVLHDRLDQASRQTADGVFHHHAVTTKMSSVKFRDAESIKALPKPRTVTSFFKAMAKRADDGGPKAPAIKRGPQPSAGCPLQKRAKKTHAAKGSIKSFFAPAPTK